MTAQTTCTHRDGYSMLNAFAERYGWFWREHKRVYTYCDQCGREIKIGDITMNIDIDGISYDLCGVCTDDLTIAPHEDEPTTCAICGCGLEEGQLSFVFTCGKKTFEICENCAINTVYEAGT